LTGRNIAPEDREALLRQVRLSYWRILKRLDKVLERSSLSARQYLILSALRQDGPTSARKLGEKLAVTPADVTGLTSRLERKALIRRVRSESDRRLVILELTDAGSRAVEAAARDRDELVDSMISSMSPNEFRMMLRGLARLTGSGPATPEESLSEEAEETWSAAKPTARNAKRRLSRRAPSPDVR
jgi:DNA-binding MarR family transcriptional regulator